VASNGQTVLRARETEVVIGAGRPFVVIGERINPTNRVKLSETIEAHDMSMVQKEAKTQVAAGAQVLDINVGTVFGVEAEIMPLAVRAVLEVVDVPLSIDSPDPAALEAGAKAYRDVCGPNSKPLLNSVNAEAERIEKVIPIAAEYGTALVGLVNGDGGIPETPEQRFELAGTIKAAANTAGIADNDLIIDALTLTVGADHSAAWCTMTVTKWITEKLGLNTTSGASNVSFGLPGRRELNTTFLAMMIASGLTSAITNPLHPEVITTIHGADLLLSHDPHSLGWLEHFRQSQ